MYKMPTTTTKRTRILQSLSLILSEDDFDFFCYKASEPTLVAFVAIICSNFKPEVKILRQAKQFSPLALFYTILSFQSFSIELGDYVISFLPFPDFRPSNNFYHITARDSMYGMFKNVTSHSKTFLTVCCFRKNSRVYAMH